MKNNNRTRLNSESHFSVISEIYFPNDFEESNKKLSKFESLIFKENPNPNKKDNFKANIVMFFATITFAIVNLIGKSIGFYYPEVNITSSNFIRGLMLIPLSHIYFYYKQINPKKEIFEGKNKQKIFLLFMRSICGVTCHIFLFLAFKNMRISSAFTIFQLMPIIVSFLIWIFLNGTLTKADIIALIICLFSVGLIVKPNFIFGKLGEELGDTFIGFVYSILSVFTNSFAVFCTKMISNDFHFSIAPYIMGYIYMIECGLIVSLSENGFESMSFEPLVLSMIMGIFFWINLYCFIHSIAIGDPVKTLPMTYLGVVLTLIFNVFIFHQGIDLLDIIGSFTIIIVNIYITISVKK